jgi:hypothetical protein
MTAKRFSPFKNEADRLQIGGLTIENRLDRISMYGSLEVTLDLDGLEAARELMEVLSLTMHEMAHANLADKIVGAEPEPVKNPFG